MISFPFAKVNIGLQIIDKRPDGFHNLESIFAPVRLFDALEIAPSQTNQTEFVVHGKTVPGNSDDNLILQAYRLLQKDFDIAPLEINLLKNIPMGAGLGGGSSNAAQMLVLCNKHFSLNISKEQLHNYALQLGSDVPFFLQKKVCHVKGRGENITGASLDLTGLHVLIVDTGIHSSTATAFKHVALGKGVGLENRTLEDLKEQPHLFYNAFESYLFKEHPKLSQLKETLLKEGCFYASLTGSGSAVFGISEQPLALSLDFKEFCAKNKFIIHQTSFL